MNPSNVPRLELDEHIRQRPELVEAIQHATARLVNWGASIGPDVTMAWRLPAEDKTVIELAISEATSSGAGTGRSRFPMRYLSDVVNCDISVRNVWDQVLDSRIERGLRRLGELATRVEEEEAAHAG